MFGKLLKAEWRASRRVIGILCLAVLIAALVLGAVGCGLFLSEAHNWTFREPVSLAVGLVSVAALMVIEVAWAASIFYALWRFYRSRFTEEGYLTWTLPVGGHSLLLSAILASVLEILLVGLATAASGVLGLGVCALGIPWREAPADFWLQIRQGLTELWHRLTPYGGAIAEAALTAALLLLSQLIQLMLSVTIGAMAAKKHPILMAILAYYGIGFVKTAVYLTVFVGGNAMLSELSVMGTSDLLSVLTILGGYFAMYFLTAKKLNLN